ncbi:MAG: hypothetical protein F6K26_46350 [Moorea sp. SIO2I5]|nr:hypothetical protein [Moorena sp. SIO2I5]
MEFYILHSTFGILTDNLPYTKRQRRTTVNLKPSTFNLQHSTFNCQHSTALP